MTKTQLARLGLLALLILAILVAILLAMWHFTDWLQPATLPVSIWDGNGQIVGWYEMNGHQAFHVQLLGDYRASHLEIIEMIETGLELGGDRLQPGHGLYMIVEAIDDEMLAFAVGLTYSAVLAWPDSITEETIPYELVHFLSSMEFGFNLRWPSWVEDVKVKTWGYAWLTGASYNNTHPWYRELYYSKPGPLDSAFMIAPSSP